MLGQRHAGVAAVAGKIPAAGKDDEAVRIRVGVARRETPVRKLSQHCFGMMGFGRSALEREGRGVRGPITAPVKDVVIGEVMPGGLLLDWHWC